MSDIASRIAGSASIALALCASAASAQPRPEAEERARFHRAVRRFERGEHEAALAEFVALSERVQRPSVLYNLGITYETLGRLPEAADTFARYFEVASADDPERRDALGAQRRVLARIAVVELRCEPDGATLTLGAVTRRCPAVVHVPTGSLTVAARWGDGRGAERVIRLAAGERRALRLIAGAAPSPPPSSAVRSDALLRLEGLPPNAALRIDGVVHAPRPSVSVPAGAHRLRVDAAGWVSWEGVLALPPGRASLAIDLSRTPRGPGPAAFWGVVGASTALLVGAAVTGALALSTHSEFSALTRDDPRALELSRRGEAFATSADVLLVSGLLGAIGAVILGTQTHFASARSRATLRAEP